MIGYDRIAARRGARFHVQIELSDLPATPPDDYERIGGAIVRVFRGDTTLKLGDPVSFVLWVCSREKEPTGPAYVYHEDLIVKGNVEAYLNGTPPDCNLVGYEFTVVSEPSEHPMLTVGELEDVLTISRESEKHTSRPAAVRKWWQVWKI